MGIPFVEISLSGDLLFGHSLFCLMCTSVLLSVPRILRISSRPTHPYLATVQIFTRGYEVTNHSSLPFDYSREPRSKCERVVGGNCCIERSNKSPLDRPLSVQCLNST